MITIIIIIISITKYLYISGRNRFKLAWLGQRDDGAKNKWGYGVFPGLRV